MSDDCVDNLKKEGPAAKEFVEAIEGDGSRRRAGGGPEWREAYRRRSAAEIERVIRAKTRSRKVQALKVAQIKKYLTSVPEDRRAAAAHALYSPNASQEFQTPNVFIRSESALDAAHAKMSGFISHFRQQVTGVTGGIRKGQREALGIKDVIAALRGETATGKAKELADELMDARQYLRGRQAAAGAEIQDLEDFGWSTHHNLDKITEVVGKKAENKAEYVEDLLDRVDYDKTLDAAGMPIKDRAAMRTYLSEALDSILEVGGRNRSAGGTLGKTDGHRAIHLKTTDDYVWYNEKYGSDDLYGMIMGDIEMLSRDVGVREVLGPHPRGTLFSIKQVIGENNLLDNLHDEVMGVTDPFVEGQFAKIMQTNRNLFVASRLGSAAITSMSDFGTAMSTTALTGNAAGAMKLPFKVMQEMASEADQQLSARMGFVADSWIGNNLAMNRIQGDTSAVAGGVHEAVHEAADQVIRKSGLAKLTEAGRNVFGKELVFFLDREKSKSFAELSSLTRDMFERFGINEPMWDIYRRSKPWTDAETGVVTIRPDMINSSATSQADLQRVSDTFQDLVRTESYYAVIRPTPMTKVISRAGAKRGSIAAEALGKNATLLKSFPITMMYMHLMRTVGLVRRGHAGTAATYAASLIAMMGGMGYLSNQAYNLVNGRDLDAPGGEGVWLKAIIKGGALGLTGDVIEDLSRGQTDAFAHLAAGPVFGGQTESVIQAGRELFADDPTGTHTRELVEQLIPGSNLWYTRMATDRLIGDALHGMFNPEGLEKATQAREKRGNSYWWRPGETKPDRLPTVKNEVPPTPRAGRQKRANQPTIGGFSRQE